NSREDQIGRLIDVAELSLWSFDQAREKIAAALAAEDPWERYWGCIVCSSFGKQSAEFVEIARRLATTDEENLVRVRAAEFLALIGVDDPRPVLQQALSSARSATEANLVLNSAVLLQDAAGYEMPLDASVLSRDWPQYTRGPLDRRIDYLTTRP